jgi:hypothetical protein
VMSSNVRPNGSNQPDRLREALFRGTPNSAVSGVPIVNESAASALYRFLQYNRIDLMLLTLGFAQPIEFGAGIQARIFVLPTTTA